MVNNTSALLTGKAADPAKMQFYCPGNQETANIVPNPKTPATKHGKFIYYWLGDTFVSGNYLYVYALRIDSVDGVFGFAQIGVDLARYEIRDGEVDFDSLVTGSTPERIVSLKTKKVFASFSSVPEFRSFPFRFTVYMPSAPAQPL